MWDGNFTNPGDIDSGVVDEQKYVDPPDIDGWGDSGLLYGRMDPVSGASYPVSGELLSGGNFDWWGPPSILAAHHPWGIHFYHQ